MPKAIAVQQQNEPIEAWSNYRGSTCPVERRRLQTVALVLENRSRREVMGVTKYASRRIVKIIRRYNTQGFQGLVDARHQNNGRPRKLTEVQRLGIKIEIQRRIDEGFIWSGLELTTYIQERYGVEVKNGSIYRLFDELGFSFQKPRPTHAKSDPEARELFKEKF